MADLEHYFGIWARNANPSDADVEAGTGAVGGAWHSGTYASALQVTQLLSTLAADTDYDLEWLCRINTVTERGTTYQFTTAVDLTPVVSDVEDVASGGALLWWGRQAYINGTDFGATQGGSTISVEDQATTEVLQTATAWSDTQITFTPTRGSLTGGPFTVHVDKV